VPNLVPLSYACSIRSKPEARTTSTPHILDSRRRTCYWKASKEQFLIIYHSYHLARDGYASRLEWGEAILQFDPREEEQQTCQTLPGLTADLPKPAQRPLLGPVETCPAKIKASPTCQVIDFIWTIIARLRSLLPGRPAVQQPLSSVGTDQLMAEAQLPGADAPSNPSPLIPPPLPGRIDVLLWPVMDWDSRTQRPQHLARHFARNGQRVFYFRTSFASFETPQLIRPKLVAERIIEVELTAPHPINVYQDRLSAKALEHLCAACRFLRESGRIERAISLVDLPFWTPLVFRLRQDYGWPVVYDCMDYHAGFSSNTQAMIDSEEELFQKSDRVLVAGNAYHGRLKQRLNPQRLALVPNGAEFEHFNRHPAECPAELAGLSGPLIGFYGAFADWIDTPLLRLMAIVRPAWQFILIGSTLYADLAPLQGLPNVHLLGEKPYADLPAYLHRFDVAIIPFRRLPVTQAMNPVKLFEYLSAGKPVVATDLDEMRFYADYATLASGLPAWLEAVEQALLDHSPQAQARRTAYALENTWEARFAAVQAALCSLSIPLN
jgi:glycosyltransferase involved in cell wall biosynthesis